ncbi:hypothetical protein NDU88_003710 [Pleurodeles waltl]|uniref:Uncharacterized protein n=1 Tax=Pleurodeles waltl TaxID=8319 RepID=A0AAV7M531_PLEWA|nr:hypothetical protein NDU88_003710 [Pleurodeles waltl]
MMGSLRNTSATKPLQEARDQRSSQAWHSYQEYRDKTGTGTPSESLLLQILSELRSLKISQEEANQKTESQLNLISGNIQQLNSRIKEVEQRVSDLEDSCSSLDPSVAKCQADLVDLQIRFDDAENSSHSLI